MLLPDIVHLKQFYASKLGATVQRLIGMGINDVWPSLKDEAVLVVGYGTPYAAAYASAASPLLVAMPAEQGAVNWPPGKDNHVILTSDASLPVQNNSVNAVLLIHSIEYSEHLNAMMQEIWRVLVPGGKVLAVVPNRMSFWSGSTKSPFGFGRPFNILQLRGLLTQHQFTVLRSRSALFSPPFLSRLSSRLAYKIERVGAHFWWFLGGVILMEAEKQLYASIKEPVFVRTPYRLGVGAKQPVGAGNKKNQKNP